MYLQRGYANGLQSKFHIDPAIYHDFYAAWDSNPGLLGEKHELNLCAVPPIWVTKTFFQYSLGVYEAAARGATD